MNNRIVIAQSIIFLVLSSVNSHALIEPTAVSPNHVTQTVYGFLDFTTTIGNTIMVFSPKSSPAAEQPKASVSPVPNEENVVKSENKVVETKPTVAEEVIKKEEIKPSKMSKLANKPASSIVHVMANSEPVTSVHAVSAPKVHVVSSYSESEESLLKEHAAVPKVLPPKVQLIEESKKSPTIISSHVEVEQAEEFTTVLAQKPKTQPIYSSVVEIQSSEDVEPALQVENNINDPEYEFLSRQPSEFAEETYRLHNIKSPNSKYEPKSKAAPDGATTTQKKVAQRAHKKEDTHPTGLVTKLGGTVVKDGSTTVHETSVIGTYISGKYAQVLQSTSHIFQNNKPKITPTPSLRILKTAAPHITKKQTINEPLSSIKQQTHILSSVSEVGDDHNDEIYGKQANNRVTRRPAVTNNSFKNRFRNNRPANKEDVEYQDVSTAQSDVSKASSISNYKKNRIQNKPTKNAEVATVSAYSEAVTPAYSNRRNKTPRQGFKPQLPPLQSQSAQTSNDNAYSRRFKPKIYPSSTEINNQQTSSLYKFKLNRQPGRWQYKTSPKPRVTIRKHNLHNDNAEEQTAPTPALEQSIQLSQNEQEVQINNPVLSNGAVADSRSDDVDLDSSSSINGDVLNDDDDTLYNVIENKKLPIETLKVEISTPADFKDTYYEIATIKSPYTFQVGSVKNTRYITVTSTFEKTFDPEPTVSPALGEPLTENILATTSHIDKENNLLDASIATLPPLILSAGVETPPLETLTETFSTTQVMLKTHILPVLYEGNSNATSYTLTQTYVVTRLVTATKTLPPMEAYQFNPSKALREFNSKLDEAGSELNLELDFGDDNENEDEENIRQELPADLDLANVGIDFNISDVDKSNIPEGHLRPKKKNNQKSTPAITEEPISTTPKTDNPLIQNLSPDQLQQLAFLRLINPGAQMPQVITTSKPVIKLETVFESHVIPIFNGVSTSLSTISRPIATVSKTEYEIGTSTLAQLPLPPQQLNPYQQQPQQFQVTTTPIVTQTMVTQTKSKILKLTFGAKTAYTTLFSTTVVPTILTTYVTQNLPYVQQTAAFPGYFPAPYAPFPYVG